MNAMRRGGLGQWSADSSARRPYEAFPGRLSLDSTAGRTMRSAAAAPRNLLDVLERLSVELGDKTALVHLRDGCAEESLTFAGLFDRARAIAAELQSIGASGRKALLLYPPGLDFVQAFFGAICANVTPAPAVPPHSRRSVPQLQAIMEDCGADLILTNGRLAPRIETLLDRHTPRPFYRLLETDCVPPFLGEGWRAPRVSGDDLAILQYTSGSTGSPKGVQVTHRSLLHNLELMDRYFAVTSADRCLSWLPHYHDLGLIGLLIYPLARGATTYLFAPASFIRRPSLWLAAISEHRITYSGAPNFAYQHCVDRITDAQLAGLDLRSWRYSITGAEPVRSSTIRRFNERFAPYGLSDRVLSPAYGMAEATLVITATGRDEAPKILTCDAESYQRNVVTVVDAGSPDGYEVVSCGRVNELAPVEIVDTQTGARCDRMRIGEICVGGPSVTAGYFGRDVDDRIVLTTDDQEERRYLRTGDLGFVDEEGLLYITGRIKDVIILGGKCHYPQDLEAAATSAHSALVPDHCVAFGIDTGAGEQVVIASEVDRKWLRSDDYGELANAVSNAVIETHGIDLHTLVLMPPGSLERTSSGKLRRAATHRAYRAGELPTLYTWSSPQD